MMLKQEAEVDHAALYRWVQLYATELERSLQPHIFDFMVSVNRDTPYAQQFFNSALKAKHTPPNAQSHQCGTEPRPLDVLYRTLFQLCDEILIHVFFVKSDNRFLSGNIVS